MLGKLFLAGATALVVVGARLSAGSASASPAGVGAGIPPADSRYFKETGQTVSGIFLDYWNSHGALPQQGYPISNEFSEVSDLNGKPYTVQYFERNRFEYHPELLGTPYAVQLGLLGVQYTADKLFTLGDPVATTRDLLYFPETGHRLGGGFLLYWQAHGGLAQFGYPLSDEHLEQSTTDDNYYTTQYFERARFEWHEEVQGKPQDRVQLGLVGAEWLARQR